MNPPVLEDIAHINLNIIIDIYKLLPFADQLRLSRASHWLQVIFKTYIWTQNYQTLEISNNAGNFSVANDTDENRLCLSPEELVEFLAVYGDTVKDLIELRECFPDIGRLKNLSTLKLGRRQNARRYLDFVAENCLNLEYLEVYLWQYPFSNEILDTKCLLSMKNLKRLTLETGEMGIEFEQFRDIVTKLQLECFSLGAEIKPGKSASKVSSIKVTNPKFLKELQIIVPDAHFFVQYFNIFENLLKLNLQVNHSPLGKEAWDTLCKAATQLDVLTIQKTKLLNEVDYFGLSVTLRELYIDACDGLTCDNLKQIFSLPNLIKFSSLRTKYTERNSLHFRLPTLLQSLNCDHFNTVDLKSAYEKHEHLKELMWYEYKDVALLTTDNRLLSCSNLETLSICEGWISLESVLQIQHLRKLTICNGMIRQFSWSFLISLLKHPTLMEFNLEVNWPSIQFDTDAIERFQGFRNNLSVVKISMYLLEMTLDFWLDLFCQNYSLLKLICFDSNVTKETLKKIIQNSHFPRDLRTIAVWGYTISCQDLRINFDETVEKLQKEVVLVNTDKCCLTLCKRNNLPTE